ncbi:putative TBC1 domain family member 14 [Paratrimastix pyriformis]|uniref:TBC1 domain family member 14 n=1 Tax=Paratrimastix pyriformis TaxID=342808 RepID=A0ABQ8U8R5_9EUKA|nr:putative TBC1 domain family member 14 [Paratrimastix pyriformis]
MSDPGISPALLHILPPVSQPADREQERSIDELRRLQKANEKREREAEKKLREKEEARAAREARLLQTAAEWKTVILPQWEARHARSKVQAMWRQGLPPCIRGAVWSRAIGNRLQINSDLFRIFSQHARERSGPVLGQEATQNLIPLDLPRTLTDLAFFRRGSPLADQLQDILQTYVRYRPDLGYVQGMSYIGAMLLLYMDSFEAFVALANLLTNHWFYCFFMMKAADVRHHCDLFDAALAACLPAIGQHFKEIGVDSATYIIDWMMTLYVHPLHLECAAFVWDNYTCDGEIVAVKAALGLLKFLEAGLLQGDFEECMNLLHHFPPPDVLTPEALRAAMQQVPLTPKKYRALLQQHDSCQSDTYFHVEI